MSWKLDMLKGKESKTVKQNHCICPNCKGKKKPTNSRNYWVEKNIQLMRTECRQFQFIKTFLFVLFHQRDEWQTTHTIPK